MIHTAKQLKDKVKNLSDGRSEVAQSLIRYYFMERFLEWLRQPFKIDISTDDVITPDAIEFKYKLMFEDRTISVLSYNLETLLAEKMQTILARGLANTRMRDFYDIYEIMNSKAEEVKHIMEKDVVWGDYFWQAYYSRFFKNKDGKKLILITGHLPTAKLREKFERIYNDRRDYQIWFSDEKNGLLVQKIDIDCGNGYREFIPSVHLGVFWSLEQWKHFIFRVCKHS